MAEYIERNALFDTAKELLPYSAEHENGVDLLSRGSVLRMVLDAPAADVAPVVHARWVCPRDPDPYVCSACRKKMKTPGLIQPLHPEEWKYCSECGAKMDEVA